MKRTAAVCLSLAFLAACTDSEPSSTSPGSATATHVTAPSVPAGLAAGSCRAAARTDGTASFGAVHTIPPRREPVAYELAVAPSRVCPGGQLRVAVQVHNRSSRTVTVAPNVIVSGPPSAWDYVEGCCERVTVPAHATRTIVATITIPLSTPLGPQRLTFRDYGEGDCCASGVSSSTFEVVTTPA